VKALTRNQAKRLARAWSGRLLEQLDAMGEPNPNVISDEDYDLVGEFVREIGERLMGNNQVDGSQLDTIAKNLFPRRK
jgi:hypothetical protein